MEAELGTPKSFPAATRPLYSGQQVTVAMLVVVGGLTCPGTSIYSESLAPQNKPIRLVLSLLLPHYTVEKTEPQRAGCTTSEEQNWHSNPESVCALGRYTTGLLLHGVRRQRVRASRGSLECFSKHSCKGNWGHIFILSLLSTSHRNIQEKHISLGSCNLVQRQNIDREGWSNENQPQIQT